MSLEYLRMRERFTTVLVCWKCRESLCLSHEWVVGGVLEDRCCDFCDADGKHYELCPPVGTLALLIRGLLKRIERSNEALRGPISVDFRSSD